MKRKRGGLCGVAVLSAGLLACVPQGLEGEGGEGHVAIEEGGLLLWEIMADPQGVDTEKEYIEIYNPTDRAVPLGGVELFVIPDSTGKEKRFALPPGDMPPGAFLSLGDVPPDKLPPHIDIGYARALGALPNTQATVGLRNRGGASIDSVHYSSTKVGHAWSRQSADANAVWCFAEADSPYDGENYGSPQQPNAPCTKETQKTNGPTGPGQPGGVPAGMCLEGGVLRGIRTPQPGELLLHELMIDPDAGLNDNEAEWVELWALEAVDLNGLELKTNKKSQKINSENCIAVEAEHFFLLASSTAPELNGCLYAVDWPLTVSLPNSSTVSSPQSLTLLAGEEILDQVTYPSSPKARSYQRDAATLKWCYVPTTTPAYDTCRAGSANRGTPGENNLPCP
ncbi:MAG: lamin tail domain-containing protein [Cystobacterineae bacterium]|nr:lamin tail domain-containing protein [Cystobacterineae bacterium]